MEQGTPATQDWTSCTIALPSGNWRLIIDAFGHQGTYTGATLAVDGVVVNASRNAGIGDTSGTGYTPIYASSDVSGGRTVTITGWWKTSTGKYADREILISAWKI